MLPQKRRKEGKQLMNNKRPITYGQRRQQDFEVDSEGDADRVAVRQPSGVDVDDTKGNHRHSGSKLFAPIKGIRSLVGKKRPSPTPSRKSPLQQSEDMKKEPSADDIATVCAFSGTNAGLAARYLKAKDNNVEAAVNAILENEDIDKLEQSSSQYDHSWDEGHFTGDRDGTGMNLQPLGSSHAPTRGPSPAPSLNHQPPKSRNEEDTDLERALQASRAELGGAPQQETGILVHDGTEVKQFGPATKEHYDDNRWAMVPSVRTSSAQNEDVPDPDAAQRIHSAGEPRFIKHTPSGDYTPNFITICHAVPAAREALLNRHLVRPDYGKDGDWWRGRAIGLPRIVHITDGSLAEPSLDDHDELIAETQRLMAFLDESARSYGNIGGLKQAEAFSITGFRGSDELRSGTLLELFLNQWTKAAVAKADDATIAASASKLFTTTVGTSSPEGMDTPHLALIDMAVTSAEGQKTDLFELLDGLIWETEPGEVEMTDNYLESPAEILVMRLRAIPETKSQLGVEVPASFHIDKYLKGNVAATRGIRQEMVLAKRRMIRIGKLESELNYWSSPNNNVKLEAKSLLKHSLGHFSGQNRRDADKNDTTNTRSGEGDAPQEYADVAAKLESVMASIEQKLELLAREKEKTRQMLADLSKSSAVFGDAGGKHRYTLRGVATKPNITYVLRRKDDEPPTPTAARLGASSDSQPVIRVEEKPVEDFDEEDTTPRDHQWWRIDYEVSTAVALQPPPRITISKAPDYDVLRAVELEHNSALLVYASEAASSPSATSSAPLPEPLLEFVSRDNDLFKAELDAGGDSSTDKQPRRPAASHDEHGQFYKFPLPPYEDDAPQQSIESHDRIGWSSATHRRRDSMDSMTMHMEAPELDDRSDHMDDFIDSQPMYHDTDRSSAAGGLAQSPEQHHGFGLGYEIGSSGIVTQGSRMDGMGRDRREIETEVAEIKLSPPAKATGGDGAVGGDVDMLEDK